MSAHVQIDASGTGRALDLQKHSLGLGGINTLPMPDSVVDGIRLLRPRLIRIFIQEFFRIYPESGRFDWSRLDPYMDALQRTGAKVMAAITIKPRPLYPAIDARVWRPSDGEEWQEVIRQLVRRYSVEKPIVTHWEVGNEPDIGEDGGSPYLIQDPDDYGAYYAMTVKAIREAYPQAIIGGPAMASLTSEPFPGFIKWCVKTGERPDFLTWHLYHSDPGRHAYQTTVARLLARELDPAPELMVTEWNKSFEPMAPEEAAFVPRRAAAVAASILSMRRAGLDGSFYYHAWDQIAFPGDFAPFFSPAGVQNMVHHWNVQPHRFGLFGVNGEARPQYFVYRMLADLGEQEVSARSDARDISVLAGCAEDHVSVLMANYTIEETVDHQVTVSLDGLRPGPKRIVVTRIDGHRRWNTQTMDLIPLETRDTWATESFGFQVSLPANTVVLVRVEDHS